MARNNLNVTTDVCSKLYRLKWHLAESSEDVGEKNIYCQQDGGVYFKPARLYEFASIKQMHKADEYWVTIKLDLTSLSYYNTAKQALPS